VKNTTRTASVELFSRIRQWIRI